MENLKHSPGERGCLLSSLTHFPLAGLCPSRIQLRSIVQWYSTCLDACMRFSLYGSESQHKTKQSSETVPPSNPCFPALWVPLLMLPEKQEEARLSHQEPEPLALPWLLGRLRRDLCQESVFLLAVWSRKFVNAARFQAARPACSAGRRGSLQSSFDIFSYMLSRVRVLLERNGQTVPFDLQAPLPENH